jgi:hypothetical protein
MNTKVTCEQVARAALGAPLKRKGSELMWRCPGAEVHSNGDANPSLQINTQKDVWACFPCGSRGKAWALAAFAARLSPKDKTGVTAWLKERGLLTSGNRQLRR